MFIHAASMEKKKFHNPHHNISIRHIVGMYVMCIAYWCVSLCCSSDLPWYVKIATPTAPSASALGASTNSLFCIGNFLSFGDDPEMLGGKVFWILKMLRKGASMLPLGYSWASFAKGKEILYPISFTAAILKATCHRRSLPTTRRPMRDTVKQKHRREENTIDSKWIPIPET